MKQRRYLVICSVLYLQLFAIGQSAPTLQVINLDGHSTSLTAEQIAKLPHVTVSARDHDSPAQFDGVPVSALLSTAGIQLGDSLHGPRMTEVLLVEASDNYKVVFAVIEFDPAFAPREIILADKRDGKALNAKEGPFRIVAPGDKRPARWIRQVTTFRLIAVK
jgi:hypothetical protein